MERCSTDNIMHSDSTVSGISRISLPTVVTKSSHPLKSCLKVKSDDPPNGDHEENNNEQDAHEAGGSTSDLEDQIKRLEISEHLQITHQNATVSSGKDEKKVAFADSKGLPLVTVKLLESPSDTPPILSEDVLKHIIQGAKPEPDHPYTYKCDFEQPAVQYLEFRERIEHKCVSLENVMIRDNIKVIGTAKVKNISFHKFVTIRVTFDEWRTFGDLPASFVLSGATTSRYDTFSFEFDIPPNQGGRDFEFCIHYEVPSVGSDFWDNNGGKNYKIVSLERKAMSQQQIASYYSSLTGPRINWGEFSYWRTAEGKTPAETPYW